MHPRLRERQSATLATRIQQLAASRLNLMDSLEALLDRLSGLPEDVPNFDRDKIKQELETSRQIISQADPENPEHLAEMSPLLTAAHKLVLKVGTVLAAYSR